MAAKRARWAAIWESSKGTHDESWHMNVANAIKDAKAGLLVSDIDIAYVYELVDDGAFLRARTECDAYATYYRKGYLEEQEAATVAIEQARKAKEQTMTHEQHLKDGVAMHNQCAQCKPEMDKMAGTIVKRSTFAARKEAKQNTGKLSTQNHMVTCRDCGKRTHSDVNGNLGLELCRDCATAAGMENEHNDGHHVGTYVPFACVDCKPSAKHAGHIAQGTEWHEECMVCEKQSKARARIPVTNSKLDTLTNKGAGKLKAVRQSASNPHGTTYSVIVDKTNVFSRMARREWTCKTCHGTILAGTEFAGLRVKMGALPAGEHCLNCVTIVNPNSAQ